MRTDSYASKQNANYKKRVQRALHHRYDIAAVTKGHRGQKERNDDHAVINMEILEKSTVALKRPEVGYCFPPLFRIRLIVTNIVLRHRCLQP